jgi:hypothetical protein
MLKRALLAAAAAIAVTGVAIANDSTAEMTAGGLVLKNSRNIDMVEEDLFLSADEVRVNYVFHNRARADENVIVAFPMPDRDLSQEGESDISHVRDFVTTVEGRPVQTQVERKAMKGNIDHTALLTRLGMPLVPPIDYVEGRADPVRVAWDRLGRADKAQLKRLGLIQEDEDMFRPLWTLKETYYWRQTFPAGRDLRISHRYKPGTGGSVGAQLAIPNLRNTPESRAMIRDYCADRDFLAGAARLQREAGENGIPSELRFGYILRTGANWRSPIRRFRLVVDKGDPRNIVSFCGTGVRRISPTQFEMSRTNWRPTQDLRVLIIRPYDRPED